MKKMLEHNCQATPSLPQCIDVPALSAILEVENPPSRASDTLTASTALDSSSNPSNSATSITSSPSLTKSSSIGMINGNCYVQLLITDETSAQFPKFPVKRRSSDT